MTKRKPPEKPAGKTACVGSCPCGEDCACRRPLPGVTVVHPAEEQPRCSFCHLRLDEVDLLAAGQSVYICDSCIDIAAAMLADHRRRKAPAAGGACKARRTAGRKPGRKP